MGRVPSGAPRSTFSHPLLALTSSSQSESPVVRKQNPTLSQPEIFKVVAERWKFAKEKAAADAERVAASVDDTGDLDIALDSLRL